MADFLLIHGSCHGAWCWRDVLEPLRAAGHGARAIDLPGHGDDPTPPGTVTLDGYAEAILNAIDGPVTLVGHSMAGFAISRVAEMAPERVARLIYLCAYLPVPGKSLVQMRQEGPSQPLMEAVVTAPDGQSFSIDPQLAESRFYQDCPPGTTEFAVPRLCPQPVAPQATPITLGDAWAGVEKHYIRCTDDRTIPPEYQVTMSAGLPAGNVSALPTGHSPFFAAPAMLVARLVEIAETE